MDLETLHNAADHQASEERERQERARETRLANARREAAAADCKARAEAVIGGFRDFVTACAPEQATDKPEVTLGGEERERPPSHPANQEVAVGVVMARRNIPDLGGEGSIVATITGRGWEKGGAHNAPLHYGGLQHAHTFGVEAVFVAASGRRTDLESEWYVKKQMLEELGGEDSHAIPSDGQLARARVVLGTRESEASRTLAALYEAASNPELNPELAELMAVRSVALTPETT